MQTGSVPHLCKKHSKCSVVMHSMPEI
jgi:hypothetical protein